MKKFRMVVAVLGQTMVLITLPLLAGLSPRVLGYPPEFAAIVVIPVSIFNGLCLARFVWPQWLRDWVNQ